MRIVAKRTLFDLAAQHPDSVAAVDAWYQTVRKATWQTLAEVHESYRSADVVGDKTVFNIRGNHYRLIVHIRYRTRTIYIKHLLTHAEYDTGTWKE